MLFVQRHYEDISNSCTTLIYYMLSRDERYRKRIILIWRILMALSLPRLISR